MRGPCTTHHHRGAMPRSFSNVDESEEFEYGPGIVSRLKNRYMSLALREAKGRAPLRKYSSLEDLLDEGPQQRGRGPLAGPCPLKREVMKRARSVDSLSGRRAEAPARVPKSKSSGALRRALGNEDIVIIESSQPPPQNGGAALPPEEEEEEVPAQDIVRQTKKIFEAAPRGTAARVAAYKAQKAAAPPAKPPLRAKPPQLLARKPPAPGGLIESARAALKAVPAGVKPGPRAAPCPKAPLAAPVVPPEVCSGGVTPITASVTSPRVNGTDHRGSPPPTPLPPSPTPVHRAHKDLLTKETERVLQENRKNREKTSAADDSEPLRQEGTAPAPPSSGAEDAAALLISSSVLDVVRAAEAKGAPPSPGLRAKDSPGARRPPAKQENAPLVFNFSKRTDTPDYIENDGVDLSKRHFKVRSRPLAAYSL